MAKSNLRRIAYQAGLTEDEAERALMIGARMLAHKFTDAEIDAMIRWQYGEWVRIENAVAEKNATTSDFLSWMVRRRKAGD